jgi:hypothetical protein
MDGESMLNVFITLLLSIFSIFSGSHNRITGAGSRFTRSSHLEKAGTWLISHTPLTSCDLFVSHLKECDLAV